MADTKWGDKTARRRDILHAGDALLRSKGLAALQMRDVAREAKVGLGTVYTYFPTKEALYTAMYAERLDRMLAELAPALATMSDFEDLFVVVATSYRDVYAEYGRELEILSGNTVDRADRGQLAGAAGRVLVAVRPIVAATFAEDPDLVLTLLWSTVTGLADHFTGVRHDLHRHTWDQAARFAARTLARGLTAHPNTNGDMHG